MEGKTGAKPMTIHQNAYPALVLNADFRPTSLYPLPTMPWERAVKAAFLDRVLVLEEYPRVLRCPGSAMRGPIVMRIPSVVALKEYQRVDRPAAFTRAGVFLRDRNRCAYCGERFPVRELTFDHVIPQCRGGKSVYTNVVAACSPCNLRKGSKSAEQAGMTLRHKPYAPTRQQLNAIAMDFPPNTSRMPRVWLDYLGLESAAADVPAKVGDEHGSESVFSDEMTSNDYWFVELKQE